MVSRVILLRFCRMCPRGQPEGGPGWAGLVKDYVVSKVLVERRAWLNAVGDNHSSGLNRKERLGDQLRHSIVVQDEGSHSNCDDSGQEQLVFLRVIQLFDLRQMRPDPRVSRTPWLKCLDTLASILRDALDRFLDFRAVVARFLPIRRVMCSDDRKRTSPKQLLIINSGARQ